MPTPVKLNLGDVTVTATLNDTVTAKAFAAQLPFTVSVSRYENDYCGPAEDLQTDPAQLQDGWNNGDIGYGDGYFSLLFDGEEISSQYRNMMIIGRLDDESLAQVRQQGRALNITVERA